MLSNTKNLFDDYIDLVKTLNATQNAIAEHALERKNGPIDHYMNSINSMQDCTPKKALKHGFLLLVSKPIDGERKRKENQSRRGKKKPSYLGFPLDFIRILNI